MLSVDLFFIYDFIQAILPPHLEEYQRLRCRVAYHALSFREEVEELATKVLDRCATSHFSWCQKHMILSAYFLVFLQIKSFWTAIYCL